jgi:hypothetical protein
MPSATTSNFLHDSQMNYLLKGIAWTPPNSLWVALFTVMPGLDGVGATEVSTAGGTNYGRIQILQNSGWVGPSGANREFSNAADLQFLTPGANWGTIVGAGLYSAQTAGDLFYIATLSTSKTVNNGDGAPKILAGQMRITRATC